MLKLVPDASFEVPVQIPVPGKDKDVVIRVKFKYLDRDELKDYLDSLSAEGKRDDDALGEIVLGWKGVDAEYSEDNLRVLLRKYPMAAASFFTAFQKEALKAKAGN